MGYIQTVDAVIHALSDASRRTVLEALGQGEATVGQLATLLPIARPGVSRHLRVLREAGLVEVRREAQRRVYSLRPEPLAEIDEWLGRYRSLWESGSMPCTPRSPEGNDNGGARHDVRPNGIRRPFGLAANS
jgi:DNA-binding transcriptional ArsR family regulator